MMGIITILAIRVLIFPGLQFPRDIRQFALGLQIVCHFFSSRATYHIDFHVLML